MCYHGGQWLLLWVLLTGSAHWLNVGWVYTRLVRMCGGNSPLALPGLFQRELPNAVREDQWPADMVKQAEIKRLAKNGSVHDASDIESVETVDVAVLIRAPVLVLNLNYVPVNICTVRRAIVILAKGKAERLESHVGFLHTVDRDIDAPSIIRLDYMVKRPFVPRKLSKKEIFLRDKFTCQYCGSRFMASDLTFDHVRPRSKGGETNWNNVVSACTECNHLKGSKSCKNASMTPIKQPLEPTNQELQKIGQKFPPNYLHVSWNDFLYWDTILETN